MKVYTKDGVVFAEAESLKDIKTLLELNREPKAVRTINKKKGAYKLQYIKDCDICGKQVKGNCGLAVHKRFAHPVARHELMNASAG